MNITLTIQERLKDLRAERGLTLEQLAGQTGLSKSALGKYETEECGNISLFAVVALAKYYCVSADYLLGITEYKNHASTESESLHLSDKAVAVLKKEAFNHQLLSEILCHPDFKQFVIDAEIFVDRIFDIRINNVQATLNAVRQEMAADEKSEISDVYLRTLELTQVRENELFCQLISTDMQQILRDIRRDHQFAASGESIGSTMQQIGERAEAVSLDGNDVEKGAAAILATLGIDYTTLTKREFLTQMRILEKSN